MSLGRIISDSVVECGAEGEGKKQISVVVRLVSARRDGVTGNGGSSMETSCTKPGRCWRGRASREKWFGR